MQRDSNILGDRCPPKSKDGGDLSIYYANEQCLQFFIKDDDKETWIEAQKFCYAKGASLMNVENQG